METIFIINPAAGQGKIENITKKIESIGKKYYITKSVGDAESFVRKTLENGGEFRFIVCGGDGTFNEVLNGAYGKNNIEICIIPTGTGNDFCKNFDGDFFDVESSLYGTKIKCDAIRYTTNGVTRYCANMFNIGFDCNVADMTSHMKKKPFISGSLAYFISILVMLIKKKGADVKIEVDGDVLHDGPLLLTSLANGKFCGGGIMSNPEASVTDGNININIVHNVSRLKFLTLLPHYMKGTHLKLKNVEKIIKTKNCKKVVITPNSDAFRICCDGEIQDASKVEFEIVKDAFNFVVPNK